MVSVLTFLSSQQSCHTKHDSDFLCKHGEMNWKRSNGVTQEKVNIKEWTTLTIKVKKRECLYGLAISTEMHATTLAGHGQP